ncbi:PREDICTED: uncharacterized protein LOC105144600 [Acromyrmex echinatior]|uniref:uncharacterized protein LOC105144600 n=1 Tax=Acromyrmex echinatior TaxID=103372 RepID=UPI000580B5B7|nr:PREDICTED: uncharacterized protein LOC105144600 [Acromyrmex echinatior]XP_011051882.1 PREDICTED: uncharacterized protein LOC105144600 [Acromyrmex echinatior]XP_011051883.1 PREDICTED: uncharacterized protein LOC105144600 [Acromyrmex echinatior]
MNFVVFGLILICCHAWAIEIDGNFAAIQFGPNINFQKVFEKLKSSLQNGTSGLEVFGIPIHEPFIVKDRLPVKYNTSTFIGNIDLKGFLENFNVSGLTSYNVNSAKFKPISLNAFIDINWPLITASTNYSLKGNAFNYDIYGNGGINGIIHNFSATMNVGFNLKDRHIQVRNIATKIFFEGSDFNVTGLFNDEGMSKIVSKTISDVTSKFITANQNTIAYIINTSVTKILNKFLLNITFRDLLKGIGL